MYARAPTARVAVFVTPPKMSVRVTSVVCWALALPDGGSSKQRQTRQREERPRIMNGYCERSPAKKGLSIRRVGSIFATHSENSNHRRP